MNTTRLFIATLFVGFQLCCLGCSSSSSNSENPGGQGGQAGSGTDPQPQCHEGTRCPCEDGRQGKVRCENDQPVCSCDECPAFEPGTAPEFVACGGDPIGRWRTESDEMAGSQLVIAVNNSDLVQCPMQVTSKAAMIDVQLELQEGGVSVYSRRNPPMELTVLDSCAPGSCSDLRPTAGGECSLGDCGICVCSFEKSAKFQDSRWTRTDSQLTIKVTSSEIYQYDYCVDGDKLTLRDASGALIRLIRAHVKGTPLACNQRSTEQCYGAGCFIGACVGGANCSASPTESVCLTHSGCSWNASACGGTAESQCTIGDYGVVPGCEFVDGTYTGCTGTESPCNYRDPQSCSDNPGCHWGPTCSGTALQCNQMNEFQCERAVSCTPQITP